MESLKNAGNLPPMPELKLANHLLGNRAALDEAWERDGYWFFRDVLDKGAVSRVRATYLDVLKKIGVVDDVGGEDAVYNGASLADYPIQRLDRLREDPLYAIDPMREFVANPAIHEFFRRLIDDEPVWLPVTEYHASAPRADRSQRRFNFLHRDSTPNKCISFRICWIPLVVVDEELGGLAMTEGLHRPRPTDNPPSSIPNTMPIPEASIPASAWRRTTYRPGDLLVFDKDSPHSGLANYSDRHFRLSMDLRLMAASDRLPMIGAITEVDNRSVTVRNDAGVTERFLFDSETYCRDFESKLDSFDEVPSRFPVGSRVIVSSENGRARLFRPER